MGEGLQPLIDYPLCVLGMTGFQLLSPIFVGSLDLGMPMLSRLTNSRFLQLLRGSRRYPSCRLGGRQLL